MSKFNELGLDPSILKSLERMQYKEPSPIQAQAIPPILEGRDLIALAQTGSGKTAACAIPVCNRVNIEHSYIQALIIVPTRELALQYATEVQKIGHDKGVKAFAIFGGEDAAMQQSKLKHGVQVLIATPGRLIDFIYSRSIDLSRVETLILDEADEMLSMGFYEDLEFIIQCLVHSHQTLLFSATMPNQIRLIAKQHMKNPLEIALISQASPDTIDHHFLYCHHEQKTNMLAKTIASLEPKQAIIFCRSRDEVERICRLLKPSFDGVDYLHAGLSQDVRTIITNKFRSARVRFLVATDVAARGLDFSGVTHVFIYHLADDPEVYVHRSGRTGRCERKGMVVTLVTERELGSLSRVLAHIKREPLWIGEPPPENAGRSKGRRNYKESSRRPKNNGEANTHRRRPPRPKAPKES
jgi:ATP-dependent RNA helicase DeaD